MTTPTDPHPDELEARQRISKQEALAEARSLLWRAHHGVLCTLSAKVDGWPFGSIVPYAIDESGRPAISIATIAEHHRNISKDPRVSLFVQDAERDDTESDEDVQAFGRVTVMARARKTHDDELEDVWPRYLFRVPSAAGYDRAHAFELFTLEIERVRYIGGFGKIFWLEPEGFRTSPETDPLATAAPGAIEHMNEDHRDALADLVRGFHGQRFDPKDVRMTGLDARGLWIDGRDGARFRVDFPRPVVPDELRPVVVETVQRARQRASD